MNKPVSYIIFFIGGIITMFIIGIILSLFSFNILKMDDIVLSTLIEGVLLSLSLIIIKRLITGGYFSENNRIINSLFFGLGYGLSETYFYIRGSMDVINVFLQRTFFTIWETEGFTIPIPGTLLIIILCTLILGATSKNKTMYILTGVPIAILILFIYNALIF